MEDVYKLISFEHCRTPTFVHLVLHEPLGCVVATWLCGCHLDVWLPLCVVATWMCGCHFVWLPLGYVAMWLPLCVVATWLCGCHLAVWLPLGCVVATWLCGCHLAVWLPLGCVVATSIKSDKISVNML